MNLITNYQEINRVAWNKFLEENAHSTIFQTPEMLDVYLNTKNYEPIVVVIEKGNEIIASLVAVIQKEAQGIIGMLTARTIIWGGPLVKNNDAALLDTLLKKYNSIASKKAIYSQFRNFWLWKEEEKVVFKNNGYVYNEHLDILHDLTIPVSEQLAAMHSGRRKNVKRAEKLELDFKESTDQKSIDECYNLIAQNYKRIKLPFPDLSFFKTANAIFKEKGYLKTFMIRSNDTLIGCRMVLCYKQMIYDWYAGSSDEHLDKYPNDYLPWKVLEWGSENKYKVFDFGGAGKPDEEYGVRDYKLKFGGKLVEFGRFEITHKPLLMKTAKAGLKLYKKIK